MSTPAYFMLWDVAQHLPGWVDQKPRGFEVAFDQKELQQHCASQHETEETGQGTRKGIAFATAAVCGLL